MGHHRLVIHPRFGKNRRGCSFKATFQATPGLYVLHFEVEFTIIALSDAEAAKWIKAVQPNFAT
jgi:hypothetical protein